MGPRSARLAEGGHMTCTRIILILALVTITTGAIATSAVARPRTDFTNTPLIATASLGLTTAPNSNSTGNSEPAIAFGSDGTMAVDGLAWLPFQVHLWKGRFGSAPSSVGPTATDLQTVRE